MRSVAPLELDVDVRPARVGLVAQPDEPVVAEAEHREDREDGEDDPEPEHAPAERGAPESPIAYATDLPASRCR